MHMDLPDREPPKSYKANCLPTSNWGVFNKRNLFLGLRPLSQYSPSEPKVIALGTPTVSSSGQGYHVCGGTQNVWFHFQTTNKGNQLANSKKAADPYLWPGQPFPHSTPPHPASSGSGSTAIARCSPPCSRRGTCTSWRAFPRSSHFRWAKKRTLPPTDMATDRGSFCFKRNLIFQVPPHRYLLLLGGSVAELLMYPQVKDMYLV